MTRGRIASVAVLVPLVLLAACGGGGGGGVASNPTPPAAPPAPPPPTNYDTAEYERSNGAVRAQAIVAYQNGATGSGVLAGVVDSGVATANAEFAGRISSQSGDFAASRGLDDQDGHGTAVADILLGAKNDSGIHGVAFNATLLVLRADTPGSCGGTDNDGCSFNDNAIGRGVDRATSAGAKVVNISLGGSPANPNLRAAIDRATAAGVIVVISAGNDFDDDPVAGANPDPLAQIAIDPASHGLVLIAGSNDVAGTISSFSNRAGNSAAFYLTALGERVQSIDQTGASFLFSGTSLSAPLVSGAVALLAQAFPAMTPAQIVDLLLRTADDRGTPGVDATYGHGELDIARAFSPLGATSIAGATVSLTGNATLGSAMGDAGQTGMTATVTDYYGRAYRVDLGATVHAAPLRPRLLPALFDSARGVAATRGATTLSLALPAGAGFAPVTVQPFAGAVTTRLPGGAGFAFGAGQGATGLARALAGETAPAFLVAGIDADGLARDPGRALAWRQPFGPLALTVTTETGQVRVARDAGDPLVGRSWRDAYVQTAWRLDGGLGPVAADLTVTRLDEAGTALGGRFDPAFGGGGAASWFADFGATLAPADGWRLGGTLRRGWTRLAAGGLRSGSTLATTALSAEAERRLPGGASVALRWAEPLRVTRGSLDLAGIGQRLDLAPGGHERDLELALQGTAPGGGWLAANVYWRQQPGNIAAAPDDRGVALRYNLSF